MATNAPYGFRPVSLRGTDPQFNVNAPQGYNIVSGYATSLFTGDPVKSSGTADANGRPGIAIATNGAVLGVFAGCEYTNAQGERIISPYWPASTTATDIIAKVYDDPDTIFSVQGSATTAATDVSNKADFVSGTGSAVTGLSAYALDTTTYGSQDCLRLLGLDPTAVGDNTFGSYNKLLVKFREHEFGAALTAV